MAEKSALSSDEKKRVETMYRSGASAMEIADELGRDIALIDKRLRHIRSEDASKLAGGVFLIGIAVLLLTEFLWPGIIYLAGLYAFVHSLAQHRNIWKAVSAATWPLALAVAFTVPGSAFLAVLLIAAGISAIITYFGQTQRVSGPEKRKNEEMLQKSGYQKRKRETPVRLTEDGELVEDIEAEDAGIQEQDSRR